jgi:hypothetical protein
MRDQHGAGIFSLSITKAKRFVSLAAASLAPSSALAG